MKLSKAKADIALKYNLLNSDLVFCELVISGWNRREAAFYAYHLMSEEDAKIRLFLKKKAVEAPGIEQYIEYETTKNKAKEDAVGQMIETARIDAVNKERRRIESEVEKKYSEKLEASIEKEVARRIREHEQKLSEGFVDIGNKDTMRSELIRMYNMTTDPKLKLDYAKQVASLDQMNKEQSREIDDRIHFHTSTSCRYCDRCASCELKERLESLGCTIVRKSASPLIWKIEESENKHNK